MGVFQVDLPRVENVMQACARALYYRETGNKHFNWGITLPNLHFSSEADTQQQQTWYNLMSMFGQLQYTARSTGVPMVFDYAIANLDGGSVYSFRFYKSFLVFALMLRPPADSTADPDAD
ncbi:MAG: hypothetical protein WCC87_14840 [Candidatus Korobacteraceae bacterium]